MDKVYAIKAGALFINQDGWHKAAIVEGRIVVGDAEKGFKPDECFSAYEIVRKCGKNFGSLRSAKAAGGAQEGK